MSGAVSARVRDGERGARMRALIKLPAERFLGSSLIGALMRQKLRGARLVLAYHGVVPNGEVVAGERALFVTQREFGRQLELVTRLAQIVPLSEIAEAGGDRPRVAITFDDAYRGAVVAGVEELAHRGLPATFFVAPGRLDDHVFWWDALANSDGLLDPAIRRYALEQLAGVDERVREWARSTGRACRDDVPPHARTASLDELRRAVAVPGITVGSHSWSHASLAELSPSSVEDELTRTERWLQREFPDRCVPWLAYPYGIDSTEARLVATGLGYLGALRVSGGWHHAETEAPFGRPRMNVSAGLSLAGFSARMNGAVRT